MKGLILVTVIAAGLSVGCANDKDASFSQTSPPQTSRPQTLNGAQSYSPRCLNPVVVRVNNGETKVEGGLTTQDGQYKASSAILFWGSESGDGQSIAGTWENGQAQVECHTSVNERTATSSKTSRVNGDFKFPNLMDLDTNKVIEMLKIELKAENGIVSTRTSTEKDYQDLPQASVNFPGLESVLVRDGAGRLILRFSYDFQLGQNPAKVAGEIVYVRR